MRSWTELSVVLTMRYRLRYRRVGRGQGSDRLFLCFLERILSLKNIMINANITGASSLSENGVLINRWTETPKVIANYGDILLVCKGSGYGKTVICDIEKAHIARQIMAIKKVSTLDMLYIRLFLQANFDQIKSKGQGVIPGIDRNSVMNMLFPIPPLAEQKRIVGKQRELFVKISFN